MGLDVNIIGAYHSTFGRLEQETLYTLYTKAAKAALEDAGVEAGDIDGVFVGNFSGGSLNHQENIAPYGVNAIPELQYKPMYRTETACSSGSSAIHMGIMAIRSGLMKRVLIVGVEKMTAVSTQAVTDTLALATYWPEEGADGVTAPCMFADLARGWQHKYGYTEEQLRPWLAKVASKAYTNAAANELAQLRKPRTMEEILALPDEKNPVIHAPLRLHDCSLISDGVAALVLESADITSERSVAIKSCYNASDYLDSFGKHKSDHYLEGVAYAVNKTFRDAHVTLNDIDLAEVHDCFTITELLIYSAIGLAIPGREFEPLLEGAVDRGGTLPVNLSGGLKAKGHPIGATGVAMHAYIYKQLVGEAYGNQLTDPAIGLVVNIGGAGTSNAVSILERTR